MGVVGGTNSRCPCTTTEISPAGSDSSSMVEISLTPEIRIEDGSEDVVEKNDTDDDDDDKGSDDELADSV